MSEKLCLKWNDFQENTNSAFGSLRHDTEFSDVTLACMDGQQVEAHKVILAASSPFFQSLLRQNKHPHPLIYMRSIKYEDMTAIVDFLYYGETNVYQENIEAFLAIAEELNLKGLTGNKENVEDPLNESHPKTFRPKTKEPKQEKHIDKVNTPQEAEIKVAVANFEVDFVEFDVNITNVIELNEKVKSMMIKSGNMLECNGRKEKATICTICGKEGYLKSIKDHIEANHLEGVSIPCTHCDKTFRSRSGLRQHNSSHHR